MIQVDPRELKALEEDLRTLYAKALPYANAGALNSMAFVGQSGARMNVKDQMINRTPYTQRSIQVSKARPVAISQQYSVVGSVADYMERQEMGGSRDRTGRKGVPIPTRYASGEARGASARLRTPRRNNQLQNVRLTKRHGRATSRRQQNAIAVSMATREGRTAVVYLDLGNRRGLFRVSGGKKRNTPKDIQMLYDLSRRTVNIPRNSWLYSAVKFASSLGPGFYMTELQRQIKKQKLFKSRR